MKSIKLSTNQYYLSLEVGDEIIDAIKTFSKKMKIHAGSFHGIGAVNDVTIGIYDKAKRAYKSHDLHKPFEVTSLSGNISMLDNEPSIHAHINLSDHSLKVVGGHLTRAIISVTGEIFINCCNKKIIRKMDKKIGINLIKI
ncbi:MAG: DNA-binding protein [Mycoplasmataceae bacterium]|jgi:predicted DNA-binding protein with PD1-like motif|nr:DNA-binding protein [Mycoplasmataceae bacterium]